MHSFAWAALLRHIPGSAHNNLMLVTRSGTEICVQMILRVDHEFVAFKGRLAGSQDAGRLFFLAFDQIDYLGFQQEVKEEAFHEMFDSLQVPAPVAAPLEEVVAVAEPVPEPEPEPAPKAVPEAAAESQDAAAPVAPSAAARGGTPIKSAVLERFRSRQPSSGVRPSIKR
jgi:hypothetical protein